MVSSAPMDRQKSAFSFELTVASTRQPSLFPSWMQAIPTPPAPPWTRTVSPGAASALMTRGGQGGRAGPGGGRAPRVEEHAIGVAPAQRAPEDPLPRLEALHARPHGEDVARRLGPRDVGG